MHFIVKCAIIRYSTSGHARPGTLHLTMHAESPRLDATLNNEPARGQSAMACSSPKPVGSSNDRVNFLKRNRSGAEGGGHISRSDMDPHRKFGC